MKYKVLISNLAKIDIIDIRTYIDFKLSSPKASQKLYLLIKSKIKMLEDNPFIYKEEIVLKKSQARIRKIKCNNYYIFYRAYDNSKNVEILRIIHSSRDWEKLI